MLCVSDKENERNQGKPALMKSKFTGVCTFTYTLLADSTSSTLSRPCLTFYLYFLFLSVLGAGSWLCQLLDIFLLSMHCIHVVTC